MGHLKRTVAVGLSTIALVCGLATGVAVAADGDDASQEAPIVYDAAAVEDGANAPADGTLPADEPTDNTNPQDGEGPVDGGTVDDGVVTDEGQGQATTDEGDVANEPTDEVVVTEEAEQPEVTEQTDEVAAPTTQETTSKPKEDKKEETLWEGRELQIKNKAMGEGIAEVEGTPISLQATGSYFPYSYAKINGKYVNHDGVEIAGAVSRGIDVSEFQDYPDWAKVKGDDVHYAILRCGYAGNTTRYDDESFLYNAKECERLGIPYGVYLYSYATTTAEAKDEANHVLRLLKGRSLALPVFYDIEDPCQAGMSASQFAGICKTFCNTIENAGYDAGVYASVSWWENYLTNSCFDNWERWVAQYYSYCEYEGNYHYWQATGGYYPFTTYVNGISGYVDTNYDFGASSTRGIRASLKDKSTTPSVSYKAHVQNVGWQSAVANGVMCGTSGQALRVEALQIDIGGVSGSIQYRTHVQDLGWLYWVKNGAVSGTERAGLRVEALQIKLTGDAANKYDIWYRAHVQNVGWQSWVKNGGTAGTSGKGLRVEGVEIRLLPKGQDPSNSPSVSYDAHVQNIGWMNSVANGTVAGTSGRSLRVEAMHIKLSGTSGGIQYRTHVQNIGWQGWKKNGAMSGTSGRSLRLEGMQIKLTGNVAKTHDVWYRAHVQNIGWQDWVKNGQTAGSVGKSLRMEAYQIIVLPKGSGKPNI